MTNHVSRAINELQGKDERFKNIIKFHGVNIHFFITMNINIPGKNNIASENGQAFKEAIKLIEKYSNLYIQSSV